MKVSVYFRGDLWGTIQDDNEELVIEGDKRDSIEDLVESLKYSPTYNNLTAHEFMTTLPERLSGQLYCLEEDPNEFSED